MRMLEAEPLLSSPCILYRLAVVYNMVERRGLSITRYRSTHQTSSCQTRYNKSSIHKACYYILHILYRQVIIVSVAAVAILHHVAVMVASPWL
jgi:hypothetical protein